MKDLLLEYSVTPKKSYRICPKCGQKKDSNEFYKQFKNCKKCWMNHRYPENQERRCWDCDRLFIVKPAGNVFFCSDNCRFMNKVVRNPDTGCWIWTAAATKAGHGCFVTVEKRSVHAHRYMYRVMGKKINEKQYVIQTCGNRRCVYIKHLVQMGRNQHRKHLLEKRMQDANVYV